MGIDTNIFAFDEQAFDLLSSAFAQLSQSGDARTLLTLIRSAPYSSKDQSSEEDRKQAVEFANDKSAPALIARNDASAIGVAAPLFFGLCSPVSFNFTSSLFVRYLYDRSHFLLELFTVGGLEGPSMELYLGDGGTLLTPDIVKRMWTEITTHLPEDKSQFYGPEVKELFHLDQKINKKTFRNVSIGFL